jgi:hypothetical protein
MWEFRCQKSKAAMVVVEQSESCSAASASIVETAFVIGVLFCPQSCVPPETSATAHQWTLHKEKAPWSRQACFVCPQMDSTLAQWKLTRVRQRIS